MKHSRAFSLLIILAVYAAALALAGAYLVCFPGNRTVLQNTLIADVLATLLVFIAGHLYRNASVYDPYWSVVPMAMIAWWAGPADGWGRKEIWFIAAVWIWGIRLTSNWIRGWAGMQHMDWRYAMLKQKNPSIYWLVNLSGIHLFPTLMVFVGMLPAYYALRESNWDFPLLTWTGFIIAVAAAMISLIADEQLRQFKKSSAASDNIETGLWKYSRHPNYFGEILFWGGLWVMAIGVRPQLWWTAIGWVAMMCMFLFISIPMMEKRNLERKKHYAAYIDRVSRLLPWKRI
jgi:steroid 5-alpha reductase family enzyme